MCLKASFEGVHFEQPVTLQAGEVPKLSPSPLEFPQLTVKHPRLWWPNGYGKPELYTLKLTFSADGRTSDTQELNFGIREITYQLSLYDSAGNLRRVEFSPTLARQRGEQVVDVSHEGMREIFHGWVASLTPGAESSPAVKPPQATEDAPASPIW